MNGSFILKNGSKFETSHFRTKKIGKKNRRIHADLQVATTADSTRRGFHTDMSTSHRRLSFGAVCSLCCIHLGPLIKPFFCILSRSLPLFPTAFFAVHAGRASGCPSLLPQQQQTCLQKPKRRRMSNATTANFRLLLEGFNVERHRELPHLLPLRNRRFARLHHE